MAKAKNKETKPEQPAETVEPTESAGVRVIARRDLKIGDRAIRRGALLGVVHLEDNVSLNYLVDAVRCDLAGVDKS